MTNLHICVLDDGITAVEVHNGHDIKYVETFNSWAALFFTLGEHMRNYASVEVTNRWISISEA